MSSRKRDESLKEFINITGCPNQAALQYLEAANWNVPTAVELFFDSGTGQTHPSGAAAGPARPRPPASSHRHATPQRSEKPMSLGNDDDELDEDVLQSALEESLRLNPPKKPEAPVPKPSHGSRSIVATVGDLKKKESEPADERQAFYAGGSDRSGQQVLGPRREANPDQRVANVFDAARQQGAREAERADQQTSSSSTKKEKSFAGAGHRLTDNAPPPPTAARPSGATAAPVQRAEPLPIRFYSNGFTVGDGGLRKFEDNEEFMEHIKRGEMPPELRNTNRDGKQVEVRLEDHRSEEYKAPAFQAFGGAGRAVGLSQSSSSISTIPESTDTHRLEQLAEKRLKTSSSNSTTIRLRLPDISTPLRIQIDLNRTLADVRRFLTENIPALQSNSFEFLEPPATKIKRDDEKRRISDAHLANSTIAVHRLA